MPTTRNITVRFAKPGFHRWPEATEVNGRTYLADRHRHLFHVEVSVSVEHNDRDIEFHDLLDRCELWWPGPELGRWSCEDIASHYIERLSSLHPGRTYQVSVWEDNEVGATLTVTP